MSAPHPVLAVPDVLETVGFLLAREVPELPTPWPRGQDLPQRRFAPPTKEDLVLAVSHAWPYTAHPDPMGDKGREITRLTDDALGTHRPSGRALLFCDFLSVSQRPFMAGQPERTPQEEAAFAKALRGFPLIYLNADAVLHIDTPTRRATGDDATYFVSLEDLEGAKLVQLGRHIHVVSWDTNDMSGVAAFDVVESVGGVSLKSMDDWERTKSTVAQGAASTWACAQSCAGCKVRGAVRMRRAPFGQWNSLRAEEKGWVFLERFASMVKAAMVPEDQAHGVAFSTSERLQREIMEGGARLREAAHSGKEQLEQALGHFVKALETKQFAAASIDKATNTGGVGGTDAPTRAGDHEVVVGLMAELVRHLSANWEIEQRAQRQRQLVMAVSRGDTVACRQLIGAGADPNAADEQGHTCLHSAAKHRDLAVARLLVDAGGDLLRQDRQGNCPAHRLGLYAEASTAPLFRLLAPSLEVLVLPNDAGVQTFQRFVAWAATAVDGEPYPPAEALIDELRQRYPDLRVQRGTRQLLTCRIAAAKTLAESVEEHLVSGRGVQLHVWEPRGGGTGVDVLYVAATLCMPFSMQLGAIRVLAERVCENFSARFLAFGEDGLGVHGQPKTVGEVSANLQEIIETLPLGKHFYLVDNTIGLATPAIWHFQERLRGAIVLNPQGWFSDDFYGSEACSKVTAMLQRSAELYQAHDIEAVAKSVGDFMYVASAGDVSKVAADYRAALAAASPAFWDYQSRVPMWLMVEQTPRWKAMRPAGRVPVVLACGALSPAMLCQETVGRMRALLPNSTIEYIPESKMWWELEGGGQVARVAHLVGEMLKRGLDVRAEP